MTVHDAIPQKKAAQWGKQVCHQPHYDSYGYASFLLN